MSLDSVTNKASVLIEALPYLQSFRGHTFLIKMGGSAMDNPELVQKVMRDIVFLEVAGVNPVVVHGGGKAISAAMKESGLDAQFIGGFRVTSPEAINIVEKTLSGTINPGLVNMIRQFGGKAAGVPGTDVFIGERIKGKNDDGEMVDIGRVGQAVGCQLERMHDALKSDIVPVISPLASELGTGKPLNVNADLAAAALAKELRATKLIYLSDVPGLMQDPSKPETLIPSINRKKAAELMADGTISGGMIPKISSALDALSAGVGKVHFIDGRTPHSLLLEIFTKSGIGTEIISE
ncbi:acetylglutamate kinase [Persicirhabdus sediminis]|uniref:Acetylglutamate kinase n=1 Tax=Persicirhabdus sediminis TaxID=454144 RepID=A0A8J7MG29_9BACT|nr:acetylglutamate kinase [Persicirhabdus sediminis]MBK1791164.1 acetylglutamate kinase [Persicirhabdus sediminis]